MKNILSENHYTPIFAVPKREFSRQLADRSEHSDLHWKWSTVQKIKIFWEFSSPDSYRDGSEHSDLHRKWSAVQKVKIFWEFSSAGSEHLPYKQRVGGSNPSTPTQYRQGFQRLKPFFYSYHLHTICILICDSPYNLKSWIINFKKIIK
jgi:hypothetical protein